MTVMPKMRPADAPLDAAAFRAALGCFPTGVAVVTTLSPEGAPLGLTISSFNSVSMEPPLVLWSIGLKNGSLPAFRAAGGFAINVLTARQTELPRIFSTPVADRFAEVDWRPGLGGLPVLEGAAAVFECRTWARHDGGDHEIFLGEVLRIESGDAVPLVFGKGRLVPLHRDE